MTFQSSKPFTRESLERRPLIQRGALMVTFDPPDVHWNGSRVPLTPVEASLLALVVRRGRVSWTDLHAELESLGASLQGRDVWLYRIRQKFARLGAMDPIETVRGWGVRLRVERDSAGSTRTLIGASEPLY